VGLPMSSRLRESRFAELEDHERGIGRCIVYSDDQYPMQPNPDHGPHK
jgi:hypothetical protein